MIHSNLILTTGCESLSEKNIIKTYVYISRAKFYRYLRKPIIRVSRKVNKKKMLLFLLTFIFLLRTENRMVYEYKQFLKKYLLEKHVSREKN